MTFSEKLNEYIDLLGISYSRLAKASGLSTSTISHYVRGEREPAGKSEQMEKIIGGILAAAKEKDILLSENALRAELLDTVNDGLNIEYDAYLFNLNLLLKTLGVKGSVLAKALAYDPSHISKILSGQRRPGDIAKFTYRVASYIARNFRSESEIAAVEKLIGQGEKNLDHPRPMCDALIIWLGSNTSRENDNPVASFLGKMDSFNLDDFIQTIHFDDIKLHTLPFQFPASKSYFGINEMMEAELDFIKATVISKSMKDCILYSDMPLEEMANDPEFPKKWMFGRAMMLKKGLHLNIIHDVNRPFNEMMLGLESHIPMYMTGQISPYFLPVSQNSVFNHLLNVSGAAALEGNAIAGNQADGKYMLFKSKDDVSHYRRRAEELLQNAHLLMDIYRSDRKEEFFAHMKKLQKRGDFRVVHCSLPLYTVSEELLNDILAKNNVSADTAESIRTHRKNALYATNVLLSDNKMELVIPEPSREQFEAAPLNLSLSELFLEKDVKYSFEQYSEHLELTRKFAESHPNLTLEFDSAPTFRNITYTIIANKLVIVSKNKSPAIHFVIHHKKMVQAFMNFIPPIKE